MKKILFLLCLLGAVCMQAQNLTVKGVVSDDMDVLPGVTLLLVPIKVQ